MPQNQVANSLDLYNEPKYNFNILSHITKENREMLKFVKLKPKNIK